MVSVVTNFLHVVAADTGIRQEYCAALGRALSALGDTNPILMLPNLCCEAAEGDPSHADTVTAAWQYFYTAAHLLDKIADQQTLDNGSLVNVATGLIISASKILGQIPRVDPQVILEISDRFYQAILKMCSGQHLALTLPQPRLDECWDVVGSRSGEFFALACWAGARLATTDRTKLDLFTQFGYHLGILIQIGDDVSGLWSQPDEPSDLVMAQRWTLPIAYSMSVMKTDTHEALLAALSQPEAEEYSRQLIIESGALTYLILQAHLHRTQAEAALAQAALPSSSRDKLFELLRELEQ